MRRLFAAIDRGVEALVAAIFSAMCVVGLLQVFNPTGPGEFVQVRGDSTARTSGAVTTTCALSESSSGRRFTTGG